MSDETVKKVKDLHTIESIQQDLSEGLKRFVGQANVKATEKIKHHVLRRLKEFEHAGLIVGEQDNGYRVGRVSILWETWTLKEKAKWIAYNKLPILKDIARHQRLQIDAHNSVVDYLEQVHEGVPIIEFPIRIEYPQYLVTSPKTIMVSDVHIKLNRGIEYISMNFEVNGVDE